MNLKEIIEESRGEEPYFQEYVILIKLKN